MSPPLMPSRMKIPCIGQERWTLEARLISDKIDGLKAEETKKE